MSDDRRDCPLRLLLALAIDAGGFAPHVTATSLLEAAAGQVVAGQLKTLATAPAIADHFVFCAIALNRANSTYEGGAEPLSYAAANRKFAKMVQCAGIVGALAAASGGRWAI
jgi:hypothetical protein